MLAITVIDVAASFPVVVASFIMVGGRASPVPMDAVTTPARPAANALVA